MNTLAESRATVWRIFGRHEFAEPTLGREKLITKIEITKIKWTITGVVWGGKIEVIDHAVGLDEPLWEKGCSIRAVGKESTDEKKSLLFR